MNFSCLFIISILILTVYVSTCIKSRALHSQLLNDWIGSILSGLKITNSLGRQFHTLFLSRRFIFWVILVLLWGNGKAQLIIFTITNWAVIIHLIIWRPFESLLISIHSILNELLLLVIWGVLYMFMEQKTELTTEPKYQMAAYVCIWLWIFIVLLQTAFTIISIIQKMIHSKRNKNPDLNENPPKICTNSQKIIPKKNIELNHCDIEASHIIDTSTSPLHGFTNLNEFRQCSKTKMASTINCKHYNLFKVTFHHYMRSKLPFVQIVIICFNLFCSFNLRLN